jgi:hypothetical protein
MDFFFPDAPPLCGPKPKDHWAFVPFMFFVLVFEPQGHVMNICLFKTFIFLEVEALVICFDSCVVLPSLFSKVNLGWEGFVRTSSL